MGDKRCRVLALDGGGIKGAFSAAILAELEKITTQSVSDHFDLIVGTSTGGLLALGLGLGKTPAAMLEVYLRYGSEIFGGRRPFGRLRSSVAHLFGPKHSDKGLRSVLRNVFGDSKIGDSSNRLVITTFDVLKGTACTFKTAHHPRLMHEYNMSAVDAAVATASGPTYFAAAEVAGREGALYLDGGVWANCPILVGIVEAVHFLGFQLSEVDVLSIGTTAELSYFAQKRKAGILGWNRSLIDVMMAGQATAAESQGKLFLGDNLLRLNVPTPKDTFKLDDGRAETAQRLAALGHGVARDSRHLAAVRSRFLNGVTADKFVPFYRT